MEKTIGFVIKCKDYSETSQLLWLYTRDFGKIKFIAKGSRRRNKKFSNKIDLFNLVEIVFYKSRNSELNTLTECDVQEAFGRIRKDLHRFALASYLAELLDKTIPLEVPDSRIFKLVLDTFKWLSSEKDPVFGRCIFEIKLMRFLGYLSLMERERDVSKGVKAIIQKILRSPALERLKITTTQLQELERVIRLVIDYSIDKRLKSLDFLEAVK